MYWVQPKCLAVAGTLSFQYWTRVVPVWMPGPVNRAVALATGASRTWMKSLARSSG